MANSFGEISWIALLGSILTLVLLSTNSNTLDQGGGRDNGGEVLISRSKLAQLRSALRTAGAGTTWPQAKVSPQTHRQQNYEYDQKWYGSGRRIPILSRTRADSCGSRFSGLSAGQRSHRYHSRHHNNPHTEYMCKTRNIFKSARQFAPSWRRYKNSHTPAQTITPQVTRMGRGLVSSTSLWEGGISRTLKEQMQRIGDSQLSESDLRAMQLVIDSPLTGPQREAVASAYRMKLSDSDLSMVMEIAKLKLTAQTRRKLVSLLGALDLTHQQRRAFDIVCDMRVNASLQMTLNRVARMDLNLESFFSFGKMCLWLRNSGVYVPPDGSIGMEAILSTPVNVSGEVGTVEELLGPEQCAMIDRSLVFSGEDFRALLTAKKQRVNSRQFWALQQLLPLGLSEAQMNIMQEIGELEAELELTDDEKELLWDYCRLEITPENRKQLDLACRILMDVDATLQAALKQVSKMPLSKEEERVFTRLADFRELMVADQPPSNTTSGIVTMRKLLIREFKSSIWRGYSSIMDTATNLFPLWTVLSAALGFFKPQAFDWFTTQWFTGALATLMLSMGVTLTVGDLIRVASQPIPIAIGFVSCYVIMPLLALGLAKAFALRKSLTAGLVLVGSLNGGQSSNLCTYIAKGDVALSILMTLSTTIGATFMIPIISSVMLGESVQLDSVGIAMSTVQIFLIPMAAGMAIKRFVPKLVDLIMPLTPVVGVLSTCALVGSAVAQSAPVIMAEGMQLQLPIMLIHVLGAVAGYWMMRLFRQDEITSRTGGIETSMKSSALGFLLAKLHFSDYAVRVPPAISVVWVALMGATIAVAWRGIPIPKEAIEARYNRTRDSINDPPNFAGAYMNHLMYYPAPLRKPIMKLTDGTKKVIDVAKGSIQATIEDIRTIRETSKLIKEEEEVESKHSGGATDGEQLKPSM